MLTLLKQVVLLTGLLVLASCGYHLRGSSDLAQPLYKVYLAGASEPLSTQFANTIRNASGDMAGSSAEAAVIVTISNERMDRRVLTLSNTGKANEFELDYALDFELQDAKGKPLLERQSVEIRRDYFNDQQAIIAKNSEEDLIRTEMYQQAVRTIVNRAQAVLAAQ
ncbi:MAG: hypothetical protein CVV13_07115 [Gammaproteobacteria bacterium HGW-Gammaproteobacteria-3]|nr:MAG: hypothetical protein CVV13_07115 [Gammaproteobacteria bacterium HGW-Gammaproteobacteria-3]